MARVMLVDDSPAVRTGLEQLIALQPDFEVCGRAENGRQAIDLARLCRPDLIVLDFSMPVMNGLQAAPHLVELLPSVILILFTIHQWEELAEQAKRAGVHAIVSKASPDTLFATARSLIERRVGSTTFLEAGSGQFPRG